MVMELLELLESLEGRDMAKMSPADADQFRAAALARFRSASAVLPDLVLRDWSALDRFAWTIEPPDSPLEWIGRFSLITTDQIEANLGQPERVRMAAALFPNAALTVDLMGDYHYPAGMSAFPALEIAVRVMGEPALSGLEGTDRTVCAELVTLAERYGFELCVRPTECAIDDQVAPADLSAALIRVVDAAREAADDPEFAEAIDLVVRLPIGSGLTDESLHAALRLSGAVFLCSALANRDT